MRVLWRALSLCVFLPLAACGSTAGPAPAASSAPAVASVSQVASASAQASTAAPAASGAKDKMRVGFLSYSTISGIEYISKGAGLYDKYGLDVDLSYVQPAILTTALNAGKDFDVGYASAANIPTVNVKGGDLVMLAASAQGGIFSIEAMPGINSIAELKGKTAAVLTIGSTTDLLLRQVLQDNKLTPEKDTSITSINDNPAMIAALTNHKVDAIVTGEPFTSIAVSQGAHVIYDQAKSGEHPIQTPVTVKRSYIAGHRDILRRLIMANMEAIHMMKTDSASAAKYMQPYLKIDDLKALQLSVETSSNVIAPDMNIPLDYLAGSLKIAAANVPEVGSLKPEDLVDLSILQEIKASGFLDKLYKT